MRKYNTLENRLIVMSIGQTFLFIGLIQKYAPSWALAREALIAGGVASLLFWLALLAFEYVPQIRAEMKPLEEDPDDTED